MAKKKKIKDKRPFAERHPKLYAFYGLVLLMGIGILIAMGINVALDWLNGICDDVIHFLSKVVTKLDAVVIVALITGTVSIVGVIISSVVAKIIDYRKSRQEYLAQKREQPYGQFVDMVYKIQENSKKPGSYTNDQMISDLSKFSREITLWGSPNVVKKWVQFRENGTNPDAGVDNLFILEEIMNEMRKDMGLKKMPKGNLLAFFINDIKSTMKAVKKG